MSIWQDKKNIGIWGAGREGLAAYEFLRARCPKETKFTFLQDAAISQNLPAEAISGQEAMKQISSGIYDLIIKSPGVSLYRKEVEAATKAGTVISSGTNLWFEEYTDAKKIVVTGTKGKSTVVSIIHHILENLGVKSLLAGNIGNPLLEHQPGADVTVIELSSYQIADLSQECDIAVFTNLFAEHVPWHGSLEQYHKDKTRLSDLAKVTVSNGKSQILQSYLGKNTIWVEPLEEPIQHPVLKGVHQQINIALALAAISEAGYEVTDIDAALKGFKMLPHRLEVLGEREGVLCVNDSISTVPEATLVALETYKQRNIILIMGGEDRGQDYNDFASELGRYSVRHIFTLPANQGKIEQSIARHVNFTPCNDINEAVKAAFDVANQGDVIMLSPAAPSYGQFKNFEHRGEVFKELCGFKT